VLKLEMSQLALQTETCEQREMETDPNLSSVPAAEAAPRLGAVQDTSQSQPGYSR